MSCYHRWARWDMAKNEEWRRHLAAAVAAWRDHLGTQAVSTRDADLEAAQTATFDTKTRVGAILRPDRRDQVPEILRIATRHKIPVHPYSSGRNWGFGSRVPPTDAVLLDLGALNRILDFDETLGWIDVEPGVTFGQVSVFLRNSKSTRFLCVTGAHPHTTLIGNALERGDAIGPYGDRIRYTCRMEVVLPTGESLVTGFGADEGSRVQSLFRHGIGPALDGLFVQSNFGVVTRMTFWLPQRPAVLTVAQFGTQGAVGGLADAVARLRQERTIDAPVGLWNDYRAASVRSTYPWDAHSGDGVLPKELLSALLGGLSLKWFGVATHYAPTPAFARAWEARVREVLGPACDFLQFEAHADAEGDPTGDDATAVLGTASAVIDVASGRPREDSTRSCYWRKPTVPETMHPDLDRCGVLWHACVVPLRAADVERANDLASSVLATLRLRTHACLGQPARTRHLPLPHDPVRPRPRRAGRRGHCMYASITSNASGSWI